jgi:hypothetical protein
VQWVAHGGCRWDALLVERRIQTRFAWAPKRTGAIPVPVLGQWGSVCGGCLELDFFRCPLLSFSSFIFPSAFRSSIGVVYMQYCPLSGYVRWGAIVFSKQIYWITCSLAVGMII